MSLAGNCDKMMHNASLFLPLRYVNLVHDLHRVDVELLSPDEKLAFFLNLYNAMVIHAITRIGHPGGLIDRRLFFSDFLYLVGGHSFSLSEIENGILRNNRKPPYSLIRHFSNGDRRLQVSHTFCIGLSQVLSIFINLFRNATKLTLLHEPYQLALPKVNPLVHFGLCNGTKSSPTVRFFSPQTVQSELRAAAREFFQYDGIQIDLSKRQVHLSRVINWYATLSRLFFHNSAVLSNYRFLFPLRFSADFGSDKEILKWILSFLDATKAGLLTHLLNDGESVRISYQNYDWSPNT